MAKDRIWKGNAPSPLSGWIRSLDLGVVDGAHWITYHRESYAGWINIKLIAPDGAPTKANYWLSWHPTQGRLSRVSDARILQENRSALHRALIDALRDNLRP